MTSKWIEELHDESYAIDTNAVWEEMLPILERIDKLLRLAKANTTDDFLYDRIDEELNG